MLARGESNYVIGMQNIFLFRSAKQEREAKFETQDAGMRILLREKKAFKKHATAEREEEMKEHGHMSRKGPAGTRAQLWLIP